MFGINYVLTLNEYNPEDGAILGGARMFFGWKFVSLITFQMNGKFNVDINVWR